MSEDDQHARKVARQRDRFVKIPPRRLQVEMQAVSFQESESCGDEGQTDASEGAKKGSRAKRLDEVRATASSSVTAVIHVN